MRFYAMVLLLTLVFSTAQRPQAGNEGQLLLRLRERAAINPELRGTRFRLPVGNARGRGYYVAQAFRERNRRFAGNYHLGEDWNGTGGGETDFGDPVYSAAQGFVVFAGDGGPGWGDVIRIAHFVEQNGQLQCYETVYGHVSKMFVKQMDVVRYGDKVAAIGNAGGIYPAHLHFELRDNCQMELGGGYAPTTQGFLDPRKFIRTHMRTR